MNLTLPKQYEFIPRYFRLTLANVLSNLMTPLATIFSTAFLGHLAEIHHLAGVALAGNLLSFLFLLLVSLRMGTTGLTAQAVGREDREEIILVGLRNAIIALGFGVALIIFQYPLQRLGLTWIDADPAVITSAINYFNAVIWGAPAILINFVLLGWFLGREKSNEVLLLSFISSAANIAGDYLLIVRCNFASTGAGISYATSQYLVLLLALIWVFRAVQWHEVRTFVGKTWNLDALKSTVTLNGNIFANNLIFILALVIFNYQGVGLGTTTYTENALLIEIAALNAFLAEGMGFGVETLTGIYKGQQNSQPLLPLVSVAVCTSLLVGIVLSGLAILFPTTLFGLLTNHREVTEIIDTYVLWLLPTMAFISVAFVLEAYFLGLTEGETVRNVSFLAFSIGFAPTVFLAGKLENNHILWLALCLYLAGRTIGFGVQLPRTFRSNMEDSTVLALEEAGELPVNFEGESAKEIVGENLEV